MIFEVALSTQCFLLIHPSPLNSPSLLICHTHIHVHIHTYTFAFACTYIYRHRHLSPTANRGVRTDRRAPPQGGRPDRRRYLRECGDPRLPYAGSRAIRQRQVRGESGRLIGEEQTMCQFHLTYQCSFNASQRYVLTLYTTCDHSLCITIRISFVPLFSKVQEGVRRGRDPGRPHSHLGDGAGNNGRGE